MESMFHFEVRLGFDEEGKEGFTFASNDVKVTRIGPETTILVPPGGNLLVFNLVKDASVHGAAFLTRPFQYYERDFSTGDQRPRQHPPPGFLLQRNSDHQCTLITLNTLPKAAFSFYLLTLARPSSHSRWRVCSVDPTLINEEPP